MNDSDVRKRHRPNTEQDNLYVPRKKLENKMFEGKKISLLLFWNVSAPVYCTWYFTKTAQNVVLLV